MTKLSLDTIKAIISTMSMSSGTRMLISVLLFLFPVAFAIDCPEGWMGIHGSCYLVGVHPSYEGCWYYQLTTIMLMAICLTFRRPLTSPCSSMLKNTVGSRVRLVFVGKLKSIWSYLIRWIPCRNWHTRGVWGGEEKTSKYCAVWTYFKEFGNKPKTIFRSISATSQT